MKVYPAVRQGLPTEALRGLGAGFLAAFAPLRELFNLMISSPLMSGGYERLVVDYASRIRRPS